jgi:drug/metabolite transporter (DMT)-like permease
VRWLPIALVVIGNLFYHLGQRAIPREANPVIATLAAYVVAVLATLATIPVLARDVALSGSWRTVNASSIAVGVGAVAIELGFLLAYRAGWPLSTASLTANIVIAVVLLALGALLFREPISASRLSGVALCLCGLWLVTRGP